MYIYIINEYNFNMSNYKVILDKDDIVLKKKDNTFKLEAKKGIKLPCKIVEMVENMEIYNLFKLLNEKLVSKCKIMKDNTHPDVLLCLKNFISNEDDNEDDNEEEQDDNYYLTFTNNIKKESNTKIVVEGKKNSITIDKDGWKKIEIDDVLMSFELEGTELSIKLKFTYIGEKMPLYAENTVGLVFRKIVKNLLAYFAK